MALRTTQLSPIGVEILGADIELLLHDEHVPSEILDLLDANGVVLFRMLGLDDEEQLAFSRRLGTISVRNHAGWSREHPGMYTIAYDPSANDAIYVTATFYWHIDGTASLDIPHKASLITAREVSGSGGDTQFASTYAAYDRLSEQEQGRFEGLKVWHSVEAATHRVDTYRAP